VILLFSEEAESPAESIGPTPFFVENQTPAKEIQPQHQESLAASSQQEVILDPLLENSSFNGV